MADRDDTSSRPALPAASAGIKEFDEGNGEPAPPPQQLKLSTTQQQPAEAQPPQRDVFSEAFMVECFTILIRKLNTVVGEQVPDQNADVKRDLFALLTQLESGDLQANQFVVACKEIWARRKDTPRLASLQNEHGPMIDLQLRQMHDQFQQLCVGKDGAVIDRHQEIQPPGESRMGESGNAADASKVDMSQLNSTAPAVRTPADWSKEDKVYCLPREASVPSSSFDPPVNPSAEPAAPRTEARVLNANNRHNELYMAAVDGKEIVLKRLLEAGMDPNSAQLIRIDDKEHLDYPLIVAVKMGFLNICELLLKHGANPSLKKAGGYTAIHHACRGKDVKIVKLLLAAGVDPNITSDNGYTSLIIAAEANFPAVVACLLEVGANVHMVAGIYTVTALYIAAKMNHKECCKLLVEAGALLDVVTKQGLTPIHIAAKMGALETVRYLMSGGADIEKPDNEGRRPLFTAASDGEYDTVKILLAARAAIDAVTQEERTALIQACMCANPEIAKLLISYGANINANEDLPRNHPQHGFTPLFGAVQTDSAELCVKILLRAGAKPNIIHEQYTPLAFACKQGYVGTVRCMLENGVEGNFIDISDRWGVTYSALFMACREGRAEIVKLLLDFGAIRTRRDRNDMTCLAVAAQHEKSDVVNHILDTPEGRRMVDVANIDGCTPLMLTKSQAIVKALLKKGASVSCADMDDNTALHWSVRRKSPPAVICMLVAAGADVTAVNAGNQSPADLASNKGSTLAETLLRRLEVTNRTRVSVPVAPIPHVSPSPTVDDDSVAAEDTKAEEDNDNTAKFGDSEGNSSSSRVSVPVVPVQHNVLIDTEDTILDEDNDTKQLSDTEGNRARVSVPVVPVSHASPPTHGALGKQNTNVEVVNSISSDSISVEPMQHNVLIKTEDAQIGDDNDTQQLSDNEGSSSTVKAPRKYKKKVRPCAHCGEVTHRRCAGCKIVFYCTKQCQKTCYAAHKMECGRTKDEDSADVKATTLEECTSDAANL